MWGKRLFIKINIGWMVFLFLIVMNTVWHLLLLIERMLVLDSLLWIIRDFNGYGVLHRCRKCLQRSCNRIFNVKFGAIWLALKFSDRYSAILWGALSLILLPVSTETSTSEMSYEYAIYIYMYKSYIYIYLSPDPRLETYRKCHIYEKCQKTPTP